MLRRSFRMGPKRRMLDIAQRLAEPVGFFRRVMRPCNAQDEYVDSFRAVRRPASPVCGVRAIA